MITLFFRGIVLYCSILFLFRMMGKRQVGQLSPFELVLTLIIADIAATPITNTGVPILYGLIPTCALFFIHELSSYLSFKSAKIHEFIGGKPSIVINNGAVVNSELKKMRYTVSDLLEQLRLKGFTKICDIQYGILEANGQLSIIPKAAVRTVTTSDLKLTSPESDFPAGV